MHILLGKKICTDFIAAHPGTIDVEAAGSIVVAVEDAGPGRLQNALKTNL